MKKRILGASLVMTGLLALSGCGSNKAADQNTNLTALMEKYPPLIQNEGTPIDGGVLKVGVVSDAQFKGIFQPFFFTDGTDMNFMSDTMCGAFPTEPDFKLKLDNNETPINVHVDVDKKEVTYKINPKFKWNDGTTVSTDDIIRTYEICANQEFINAYQSPRYGTDMQIIEGIVDYNQGKADHISGLEKISDSEMKIHLTEITPGVYYGGPFCGEFVKASSLEGVPMDEILECDAVRVNPPSYGPYVITNILPGEHVSFEANPYYYKGEAKVKKVEMQTITTAQQVSDIQSGGHDIYVDVSSDVWPQITELNNVSIGVRPALYMSFLGFNLGHWDAEQNVCVTDPDAKMSNVNLRKAMGYCIDNDTIGSKYYNGLRFTAISPIAPVFTKFHDPSVKGYTLDLEKAKKLLDEAGYVDKDGDGFREDPQGNPLEIHLAMMSGGETAEPLSQYYIQQWEKVGLKASLTDGKLLEFNDFYKRVQANDPTIDVFMAAFGLASDPNPTGLWGAHEQFNLGRYTSDKLEDSLQKIGSSEALDPDKQIEFYRNFERIFEDEAPAIPQQNKVEFQVVNKRVKEFNFDRESDSDFDMSKVELTADKPMAS